MPTFSCREKNVTISVRCGARCRAYHASSMGEGKGPPHNCAAARFLFFWVFQFHGESLSIWRKLFCPAQSGPAAPQLASPSLQSLNPSSGHANQARIFSVRRRLSWRRPPRKALTLRRATPTRPGRASGNPGFPFPIRRECDEYI